MASIFYASWDSSQQCALSIIVNAELLHIKQSGFPCQFSHIMLCDPPEKLLPPWFSSQRMLSASTQSLFKQTLQVVKWYLMMRDTHELQGGKKIQPLERRDCGCQGTGWVFCAYLLLVKDMMLSILPIAPSPFVVILSCKALHVIFGHSEVG